MSGKAEGLVYAATVAEAVTGLAANPTPLSP